MTRRYAIFQLVKGRSKETEKWQARLPNTMWMVIDPTMLGGDRRINEHRGAIIPHADRDKHDGRHSISRVPDSDRISP